MLWLQVVVVVVDDRKVVKVVVWSPVLRVLMADGNVTTRSEPDVPCQLLLPRRQRLRISRPRLLAAVLPLLFRALMLAVVLVRMVAAVLAPLASVPVVFLLDRSARQRSQICHQICLQIRNFVRFLLQCRGG